MPDLHLAFGVSPLLLTVAAAAAAVAAWFVYRTTVPPVSRLVRIVLTSLRAAGLCVIFSLIAEPLVSLVSRTTELPVVYVLIDNSRSMTIHDRNGDRNVITKTLLASDEIDQLGAAGAIKVGKFDSRLTALSSLAPDSLLFNGDGTDIAAALTALKRNTAGTNLQGVILLTDGNATTGANPVYDAEAIGVPVFTIGIGDTSVQKDVLVHSILMNEICYVGSKVPINVRIRSAGFVDERVEVTLQQNNVIRDRAVLMLGSGIREYPVSFSWTPDQEGLENVTVSVSILKGELTERNNRATAFTRVLKSRMNVLLVGGGPGPDVAFLRRSLGSDKNIKITTFVEKGGGQFYEGQLTAAVVAEAECLILSGFPTAASSASAILTLLEAATNGTPMMVLMSRTIDVRKLSSLDAALPFSIQQPSANELEMFVDISETQRLHPLIRSDVPPEAWAKLPPLFRLQMAVRAKPDAVVLANARLQSMPLNEPMIIVRQTGGRKSAAFLGYGLWRWTMMGEPATAPIADALVGNAVRWLTTREDDRRVRVRPVKEMFHSQEPVEFAAQVYDESYKPVDDAQIAITVRHRNDQSVVLMSPAESGRYTGVMEHVDQGDYTYTASVTQSGRSLAEEKGSFTVGGVHLEFIDTRMNRPLLQQIASRTGGRYYDAAAIGSLAADIAGLPGFMPREVTKSSEIELWNAAWMLATAVLLFAAEWFLRKRKGML